MFVYQPRTQMRDYWEHQFSLKESDIEQLYNHFLEVGKPQSTGDLVRSIMEHRVLEEKQELLRRIKGYTAYEPKGSFGLGDKLVFPYQNLDTGEVMSIRDGVNPDIGDFKVVSVKIDDKIREYASDLPATHSANLNGGIESLIDQIDSERTFQLYHSLVEPKLNQTLEEQEEFIVLGGKWFVKALLADVGIGQLHLAEAVLDMNGGGPLDTASIVKEIDLENELDDETKVFSLNYALINDDRFDEVAPRDEVTWFLHRMEPESVLYTPDRLKYEARAYDKALLSSQLNMLVHEIGDEWSDMDAADFVQQVSITINYPHRISGTLPLNHAMMRLLPLGRSPRQIFIFKDVETQEEIPVWVIKKDRYIYGLQEWFAKNQIVVGAYINVKKSEEENVVLIDYQRRRPQREDVRFATVDGNRLAFDFQRRPVGCGFDDLTVIGTDSTNPIDVLWKRTAERGDSLATIVADVLPTLSKLSLQNAVHSKTIYSVVNMLRRTPPEPLFAELVRNPAFQIVGDHYWRFDSSRWRG